MKYSKSEFVISEGYEKELMQKKSIFSEVTRSKNAVHLVLVTTEGIRHNAYSSEVQNEINLDDLFEQ